MDVDHGYADLLEEFGRENLHVSREDYEIDLAGKELEHARLCVSLGSRRDWDVVIRDTEAENIDGVVGMVREDGDNVCIELATAPAPEEVQEAMVVTRGEQRYALAFARVRETPIHSKRTADPLGEGMFERLTTIGQSLEPKLHPHEEGSALGIGRVLVGAENVGVALVQEGGNRGDNPVAVGT